MFNWGWDEDLSLIKVDIDTAELGRLPEPITGIHGETAQFIAALNLVREFKPRHHRHMVRQLMPGLVIHK